MIHSNVKFNDKMMHFKEVIYFIFLFSEFEPKLILKLIARRLVEIMTRIVFSFVNNKYALMHYSFFLRILRVRVYIGDGDNEIQSRMLYFKRTQKSDKDLNEIKYSNPS